MTRTRSFIVVSTSVVAVLVVGVLFVTGFFEKFGPPIRIVIPEEFSGVACGRLMTREERGLATWALDSRGYFEAGGEAQSHRPRQILIKDRSSAAVKPAMADVWHPIFTESDSGTGRTYAVAWVGAVEGWDKVKGAGPFCIHRFN